MWRARTDVQESVRVGTTQCSTWMGYVTNSRNACLEAVQGRGVWGGDLRAPAPLYLPGVYGTLISRGGRQILLLKIGSGRLPKNT